MRVKGISVIIGMFETVPRNVEKWKTNQDLPNYIIIEISQNTEKSF